MRNAADLLKMEISVRLQDLQRRKGGLAPLDPDEAGDVDRRLTALLGIAEAYDGDAAATRADPDLSEQGRRKTLERIARATLEKLAAFEGEHVTAPRQRVAARLAELQKRPVAQRPTDLAERLAYELRLREVRDELRRADPLEVDLIAMTSTDPLVLDAIATAPPVLRRPDKRSMQTLVPFVSEERVAAARLARAREADPVTAASLDKVERLSECFAGAVGGVRSAILEQVSTLQADPVAEQVRGR